MSGRQSALERLIGPVSRETFSALSEYEAELIKWNQQINLVSPSTLAMAWDRHIVDSAQLIPLTREAQTWVDLGSGGGFPGIVAAIFRKELPDSRTILVESNRKKAGFLRHLIGRFELPARVDSVRIEDHIAGNAAPDIISARALAPLVDLLDVITPWLERGSRALFHKGRDYAAEIEQVPDIDQYDLVKHISAVDAESVILEMRRR